MPVGLLGKKIGMTQIFDENGGLIPVTLIVAGPCTVVETRDKDKDGYEAVALGFDEKKESRVNKAELGKFKKAGATPSYLVREFRTDGEEVTLAAGDVVDVNHFEDGERIDVVGTTKGRGFQGTLKRFNTSPGPNSHGSMYHRRPGSGGQGSDPSRVYKGKKNPGHMGTDRVTVRNLVIVKRDTNKNLLYIKGSVPGHNDAYVMIKKRAK